MPLPAKSWATVSDMGTCGAQRHAAVADRLAVNAYGLTANDAYLALHRITSEEPPKPRSRSLVAASAMLRDAATTLESGWPPPRRMRPAAARLIAQAAAGDSTDPPAALKELADRLEDNPAAHTDALLAALERISSATLTATARPGCGHRR